MKNITQRYEGKFSNYALSSSVSSVKLRVRIFLIIILLFLTGAALYAQTADEIETLLNTRAVTYGQAARFVLEASDALVTRSHEEAFRYAVQQNWLPANSSSGDPARFDQISLLLMRSFNMKGGLMYTLTKSSHHAYRELVYRNVIQTRSDPAMTVSGEELLFMVGRLLSMQGTEETVVETPQETEVIAEPQIEVIEDGDDQERLLREINSRLEAAGTAEISAQITEQGIMISIPNIQFVANSAELTQEGRNRLEEAARILRSVPERNILVAGHTALAGTTADQMYTSLERARAAADYLVSTGVRTAGEIIIRGYGGTRPIADNATVEGMAQNRRVEITILTAEAMENLQ